MTVTKTKQVDDYGAFMFHYCTNLEADQNTVDFPVPINTVTSLTMGQMKNKWSIVLSIDASEIKDKPPTFE